MNLAVFGDVSVRKLKRVEGGQSPVKVVQEFLLGIGGSPSDDEQEMVLPQSRTWQAHIPDVGPLTVELENTQKSNDVIITLAFPLVTVPIKNTLPILIAALELCKPLVGCRLYLEENRLIIAASICGDVISVDNLSLHYELIKAQRDLLIRSLQQFSRV
jgi:hypothetical protein